MHCVPSGTRKLRLAGMLIVLNLAGCALNSPIPVAVPCPQSPSAPGCLVTPPAVKQFQAPYQSTSQQLDKRLTSAEQQLSNSEKTLRDSLNKPTSTPAR